MAHIADKAEAAKMKNKPGRRVTDKSALNAPTLFFGKLSKLN